MKKSVIIVILIILLLLIIGGVNFFKLSDLSPDGYSYPNDPAKAQQLMTAMGDAHNIAAWDSIETYHVDFTEEFYGFLGKQAHPFKEQKLNFSLDYNPHNYDGRMEIASGADQGKTWGIQSWQTYLVDENGHATAKDDADMTFWIPTYQYFIELPKRIQEASVVDYVGTQQINGITTEGVIASWQTVEPQKTIDQYVVWIDANTKKIVKVEYTVRDTYPFVSGAAHYTEYKDYNGIILPSVMPVESNLKSEGFLHQMSINSFTPNRMSVEDLTPLAQVDVASPK